MTKEQAEAMRKKLMVATLARKRLVEVAAWLSGYNGEPIALYQLVS